jgi:mevalonate kinase
MAITIQKAPGKIILFGEHAVVYGKPAIAVPLVQRFTTVTIQPLIKQENAIQIEAPDIHLNCKFSELSNDHPLALIIREVKTYGRIQSLPSMKIRIHSTLPVASGLGSGASVSVALAKALCEFLGLPSTPQDISQMAFEAEKTHHGTPSGIDNTVIAFGRGLFYQRDQPIEWLSLGKSPINLLIVNSGEEKSTKDMVSLVREELSQMPEVIQPILDQIGELTLQARCALEAGESKLLGTLMCQNHTLLQKLGVSTPILDNLVNLAMSTGALGAKLSGAGGGGNIIILLESKVPQSMFDAFAQAGYMNLIETSIQ